MVFADNSPIFHVKWERQVQPRTDWKAAGLDDMIFECDFWNIGLAFISKNLSVPDL